MIMQYYGGYMNSEDIRDLLHTDKNGTTAYNFIEGAKSIGFKAKGVSCPTEKILEEDIICPCIANVTVNSSYSHFIVIYEINRRKKKLLIADPAKKISKISFEDFSNFYSGYLLILYPKMPLLHFQKRKITWDDIRRLLNGSEKFLIQIFFLSIFILIYAIVTSFYNESMLKGLQSSKKEDYLLFLFSVFAILTFLKITSEFFRSRLFIWIEKKIDVILTKDTFFKVLFLPYQYYHNHTTGDIISRIQGLENIKVAISKWVMTIMIDIPLMIISFICLYFLHSKLSMLILIFFIFEVIIIKIFHETLEERIEECQKENAIMTNLEVEGIRSFETIKGISLEKYFEKKLNQERVFFLQKLHQLENLISLENYGKEILQQFSTLLLLLFGCLFVRQNSLTFSTLLTIQSLSFYFYTPLRELIDLDRDTKQARNAWNRISVFSKEKNKIGYLKDMNLESITFNNLSYSYKPDIEVLHHISLKIRKNEKVLVLGSSGSGKSTLFKLLKCYYEIPRGMILIDDNDINDYGDMRKICYIHQNENLYTGSMLDNIKLDSDVSDEKLKNILKICEVEEISKKSHLGYYQLIEENGINLSGGERQRIILARTLLRPFHMLIIDEGLNQIDVNLERRILKKMFKEFQDKMVIVISHREENMDLFQRKIRIEQGKIVEDVIKNGTF